MLQNTSSYIRLNEMFEDFKKEEQISVNTNNNYLKKTRYFEYMFT